MIAIALYRGAVNVRPAPALDNTPLFTTAVPDFARLLGITRLKTDPLAWLHVEFDDGRQGYTREDKTYVVGDLSLLGAGKVSDVMLAQTALGTSTVQPPVNGPTPPPTSGTRLPAPVTPYVVTEGYHGDTGGHKGVDMAGATGSPVTANVNGTVIQTVHCAKCIKGDGSLAAQGITDPASTFNDNGFGYGFGNFVVVRYPWQGQYLFVLYGHLATIGGAWPVIGTRGSTGNSSGSHLHIECHLSSNPNPANIFNEPLINPAQVFAI